MKHELQDPYAILEVSETASNAEIKAAYRRLILQYHPDVNPDPAATERAKRITEAYRRIVEERREGPSLWLSFETDDESETPGTRADFTHLNEETLFDHAAVSFSDSDPVFQTSKTKPFPFLGVSIAFVMAALMVILLVGIALYRSEQVQTLPSFPDTPLAVTQEETLIQQIAFDESLLQNLNRLQRAPSGALLDPSCARLEQEVCERLSSRYASIADSLPTQSERDLCLAFQAHYQQRHQKSRAKALSALLSEKETLTAQAKALKASALFSRAFADKNASLQSS